MRTVLVTGGAGFIGGHVVKALVTDGGYRVVNVDALTYASDLRLAEPLKSTGRYEFERIDIRDRVGVDRLFSVYDPDGVLHLAAESHVDRSIENPLLFVETNVLGTANLLTSALSHFSKLNAARKECFRFLHVSTDEVFGSLGQEGLFSEITPYDPSSPYSASKAASDHLVRAWGRTYGLPVLITNCSNNYGPGQFPEKLIPLMILRAWKGEPLPVYGRGENVRDWLHVEDHAQALKRVMERGTLGETYCVGGRSEFRNIDIVHMICDALDERLGGLPAGPRRGLVTFVKDRPGHDERYAIDPTRIANELGWQPSCDLETGLKATIDWYVNNKWWWSPLVSRASSLDRIGLEMNC